MSLTPIFAKLIKLNISMQGPDKNMLDTSDKIVAFIKKLLLWEENITNVSGVFSALILFEQKYKLFTHACPSSAMLC